MCGIYASVGFAPEKRRLDVVAHRGPDGEGWREFSSAAGRVALGHRRLAIIDLSDAAAQPMADRDDRYWLTYNGEIYNYLELRAELEARGERFRSDSDSEVLLRAYAVWGEACLPRLRGMFALVVWDDVEKTLFAARDRFGIKPLYYVETAAGVAFASEIKQLMGLPGLSARMNRARVHDFLASGITNHTAETLFEGVRQVRGGEYAVVRATDAADRGVGVRRWHPTTADVIDPDEETAGARFRELFQESVRLHLRSDVTIGSCLSGGLDSSSIVCVMSDFLAQQKGAPKVTTVSACYAEKSVDEKPFMEAVVARTGANPRYIYPKSEDVFARAEQITWHQDEPFGSTSIFAQWCVFEDARKAGVKVMLDGQGADEQLAGYHSSFHYYLSDLAKRNRRAALLRTFVERKRVHGVGLAGQYATYGGPLGAGALAGAIRALRKPVLPTPDWMGSDYLRGSGAGATAFRTAGETLGLAPVEDLRTLCLSLTYASNLAMLLHWEDRNSMAHSIEARVPFLDPPLVAFCLSLADRHKIVGADTKRVLRRAMKGILPEEVRQRRDKLGFATPESIWFRGPLRRQVEDGVEATLSRYPDLLDPGETRAFVRQALDGARPLDFTTWRIVNVGIWGALFGISQ